MTNNYIMILLMYKLNNVKEEYHALQFLFMDGR
nr:MAG TPA: hypothetical protein [Caudoviricetes sp.]